MVARSVVEGLFEQWSGVGIGRDEQQNWRMHRSSGLPANHQLLETAYSSSHQEKGGKGCL